ncbi:7 transmembrane receptor (rhodopsin family) domain-containing protein [Ditylenchus destructor]|uniref:7 transmembrane receptor (Rhodopsin family) domain-containing protein n=1 Tax=Ditylenchus destructor TaxID=166010 RepID=A0AAD4MVG3_9BILA|nr:7 transmembrane receptor (rhodopsin family) domain-containing protein [Ditylenchus destructor]
MEIIAPDNASASFSDTTTFLPEKCQYFRPVYLEERFWLVTVLGTSVALISVIENLFLFFMLVRKRNHHKSHCLYLLLLAFFDVFMGAAYIPLMSFSLLLDYLESVFLLRAWYAYMVPLITISHIAMTSSSFLILAASFERFCITCWASQVKIVNKSRKWIAAGAIILGFVTKLTMAGEFEIIFNEECFGTMTEYTLRLSELAMDYYYNLLWRLGFRNVVTVLLPFFLLLIMNIKIVSVLRSNLQLQMIKVNDVQRKKKVRAATRTLLMIVFTYLLANVLNVVLTFWEYINMEALMNDYVAFYTFGVDTVSILTILAGALRLPIYVCCMPQLRKEFVAFLKQKLSADICRSADQKPDPNSFFYTGPTILRISEMLMRLPRFSQNSTSTTTTTMSCTDSDDDSSEDSSSCSKSLNDGSTETPNTSQRLLCHQDEIIIFKSA